MRGDNPFVDESCEEIAQYLKTKLNGLSQSNPNLVAESGQPLIIVNGTRCYDAFNVPYSEYPLLKVYRMVDNWQSGRTVRQSQAVVSYSLVLPDQERLASILAWLSRHINIFLLGHKLICQGASPSFNDTEGFRAEYRNMLNELTTRVHSFLRFNITIKDD